MDGDFLVTIVVLLLIVIPSSVYRLLAMGDKPLQAIWFSSSILIGIYATMGDILSDKSYAGTSFLGFIFSFIFTAFFVYYSGYYMTEAIIKRLKITRAQKLTHNNQALLTIMCSTATFLISGLYVYLLYLAGIKVF